MVIYSIDPHIFFRYYEGVYHFSKEMKLLFKLKDHSKKCCNKRSNYLLIPKDTGAHSQTEASSWSWRNLLRGEWYYFNYHLYTTLQWRHNERYAVSNQQPYDCLRKRLFRHRSTKTSKLHVTGLCEGNSPVTDEFPAQRASNAENVSIWWRHHDGAVGVRD